MPYKALYLKYRPQTFEEVAGQKPIVRTLKNALLTGKMAHAYLFAGPRGTGKTLLARLFAKALDCEEGLGHQCNACSNCREITDGSHPDVIEIDAASNNGVDQVRDLIEKVRYSPIKGKYKVYIIDEVHMMSIGAFNALLKTIEEPPEKVIFILCTTEPYKVIPTILSRCQRFDFAKLSNEDISHKLREILDQEGTNFDNEGLKAIVDLADGGMRDALSILDQVLAYSGNVLCSEDVLAIYGLASMEEKVDLVLSIKNGDVTRVVRKSEAYLSGGVDVRRLVSDLISLLKDLLIYEKTNELSLMEKLDEEDAILLSKSISPKDCNALIADLIDAQNNFKNVSDIRSLFELTLLRMASSCEPIEQAKQPIPAKTKESEPRQTKTEAKSETSPQPNKETSSTAKPTPVPVTPKKVPVEEIDSPLFNFMRENRLSPQKKEATVPDWLLEKDEPLEKDAASELPIKESDEPSARPAAFRDDKMVRATHLDISKVTEYEIVNTGKGYTLTDEQIFNISVLASKDERAVLKEKWPLIKELVMDPKYGSAASLLFDATPFCLCKQALVLSYQHRNLAEKANIAANQEPLAQLVETMLGRRVFVYALDPDRRLTIRGMYYQKMQLSQIPSKKEIVLDLPKLD